MIQHLAQLREHLLRRLAGTAAQHLPGPLQHLL